MCVMLLPRAIKLGPRLCLLSVSPPLLLNQGGTFFLGCNKRILLAREMEDEWTARSFCTLHSVVGVGSDLFARDLDGEISDACVSGFWGVFGEHKDNRKPSCILSS